MTPPPTPVQSAAHRLAGLISRIAEAATAFVAAATPAKPRAIDPLARLLELCALLVTRLAAGTSRQTRAESLEDEEEHEAENDGEADEEPEDRLERVETLDRPARGAHRSTPALIAEIHRELEKVAKLLGHPIPQHLESLVHQAIAAAIQLERATLAAEIATLHPQHPHPVTTPSQDPAPATTLEL